MLNFDKERFREHLGAGDSGGSERTGCCRLLISANVLLLTRFSERIRLDARVRIWLEPSGTAWEGHISCIFGLFNILSLPLVTTSLGLGLVEPMIKL